MKATQPLAVAPLNWVIALAASSGTSYVTMATPDERPLRSYFINWKPKKRTKTEVGGCVSGKLGAFEFPYPN